jgi:signal transduction histidine kinase
VSRVVADFGGRLYVTTAPGEGTTFCLSLPVPDVELNS